MWDKSAGIPGKDCDTFQGDGEKGSEDYRMLAGRKCRRIMKAHDRLSRGEQRCTRVQKPSVYHGMPHLYFRGIPN